MKTAVVLLFLMSFQASASYRYGTFNCFAEGKTFGSQWFIKKSEATDLPLVEYHNSTFGTPTGYSVRGFATVTEQSDGTILTLPAAVRGGGYFNLFFRHDGDVMFGPTKCQFFSN
jgi:hypothetical protein